MKSVSGKKFAKILKHKGWKLARIQGSHHIFIKSGKAIRVSVPIHANQDLKIGLLRHLMKQADISEDDLS